MGLPEMAAMRTDLFESHINRGVMTTKAAKRLLAGDGFVALLECNVVYENWKGQVISSNIQRL